MSHDCFFGSSLSSKRVWTFLYQVDEAEAALCRAAGCPRCGGRLHSAKYPRKPHGLARFLQGDVRRFSLCCAECRCRVTPASVRFFGRRRRVGVVFVADSVLLLRGKVSLEAIRRKWGIPVATLRRWRQWWRETFVTTRAWQVKKSDLVVSGGEGDPLVRLLHLVRGRSLRSRLLRVLIWLLPWTGFCPLGAGWKVSAENGSVALG